MSESITITLPWPPSDNSLKVYPVRGRFASPTLSKAARDYYSEVSTFLVINRVPRLSGPLHMHIEFYPPDKRLNDGPNRWKALQDSLKRRYLGRAIKGKKRRYDPKQMGWVFAADDSQVVEWSGKLFAPVKNGKAIVTLTKLVVNQADLFVDPYPESEVIR